MAAKSPVQIVYGAESLSHVEEQEASSILEVARNGGITEIDTAYLYANSERMLGRLNASEQFTIHTKAPGVLAGCMNREGIINGMRTSLEELGVTEVDIYYLHTADPATPLEETLLAVQQLYDEGKFRVLGISNLSSKQVQELYDLAKSNSYVLPSVYQGNYNPVARHAEEDLLPLLRKLGISFYAYSPLAGGFLAKTALALHGDKLEGRWNRNDQVGQMYHKLYNRPSLVAALDTWEQIAHDNDLGMAEMAYRWMLYHSSLHPEYKDRIIVGTRRAVQLEDTLKLAKKGPLVESVLSRIEAIWPSVALEVSHLLLFRTSGVLLTSLRRLLIICTPSKSTTTMKVAVVDSSTS